MHRKGTVVVWEVVCNVEYVAISFLCQFILKDKQRFLLHCSVLPFVSSDDLCYTVVNLDTYVKLQKKCQNFLTVSNFC